MINGNQTAAHQRLKDILAKLRDGAYGVGDQLDVDALNDDLDDVTADM